MLDFKVTRNANPRAFAGPSGTYLAEGYVPAGEKLILGFDKVPDPEGLRAEGRAFGLVHMKIGMQHLITHGTSNHVPTIDALRRFEEEGAAERLKAQMDLVRASEKAALASAELAAARARLAKLS